MTNFLHEQEEEQQTLIKKREEYLEGVKGEYVIYVEAYIVS